MRAYLPKNMNSVANRQKILMRRFRVYALTGAQIGKEIGVILILSMLTIAFIPTGIAAKR